MEQPRMQAADLLERGVIPAEIARQVGVAHQVVSEWRKAWRQGGREALRSAGPAGRKSKLSDRQFGRREKRAYQWRRSQRVLDGCVDVAAGG